MEANIMDNIQIQRTRARKSSLGGHPVIELNGNYMLLNLTIDSIKSNIEASADPQKVMDLIKQSEMELVPYNDIPKRDVNGRVQPVNLDLCARLTVKIDGGKILNLGFLNGITKAFYDEEEEVAHNVLAGIGELEKQEKLIKKLDVSHYAFSANEQDVSQFISTLGVTKSTK